jgi:hypothetical protein
VGCQKTVKIVCSQHPTFWFFTATKDWSKELDTFSAIHIRPPESAGSAPSWVGSGSQNPRNDNLDPWGPILGIVQAQLAVFLAHANWGSRDIAHISSFTCTAEVPKRVLHALCVICLNGQNWVGATILPASAGHSPSPARGDPFSFFGILAEKSKPERGTSSGLRRCVYVS